jgi:hypothetical protein
VVQFLTACYHKCEEYYLMCNYFVFHESNYRCQIYPQCAKLVFAGGKETLIYMTQDEAWNAPEGKTKALFERLPAVPIEAAALNLTQAETDVDSGHAEFQHAWESVTPEVLKYYLDGAGGDVKMALGMFLADHPAMEAKLAQLPQELLVQYLDGADGDVKDALYGGIMEYHAQLLADGEEEVESTMIGANIYSNISRPDPLESTKLEPDELESTKLESTKLESNTTTKLDSFEAAGFDGFAAAGSIDGFAAAGSIDGFAAAGSIDGFAAAGSIDGFAAAGSIDRFAAAQKEVGGGNDIITQMMRAGGANDGGGGGSGANDEVGEGSGANDEAGGGSGANDGGGGGSGTNDEAADTAGAISADRSILNAASSPAAAVPPVWCTDSSGTADAGSPCVFPFVYEGVAYSECTDINHPVGAFWCASSVSSGGEFNGLWGECDRCPAAPPASADAPILDAVPPASADAPISDAAPPALADAPISDATPPASAAAPILGAAPPASADAPILDAAPPFLLQASPPNLAGASIDPVSSEAKASHETSNRDERRTHLDRRRVSWVGIVSAALGCAIVVLALVLFQARRASASGNRSWSWRCGLRVGTGLLGDVGMGNVAAEECVLPGPPGMGLLPIGAGI